MPTESDLRQLFADLADAAPEPSVVVRKLQLHGTALPAGPWPRRRPTTLIITGAAMMSVVLLVVMLAAHATRQTEPAGPTLSSEYSGSMTIDPNRARPGELVTIVSTRTQPHGLGFTLDAWSGSGWDLAYYLVSDRNPVRGAASWWAANDPPIGRAGWPDIATTGGRVVVPPVAAAGIYRLCTYGGIDNPSTAAQATAALRSCALLTVAAGPVTDPSSTLPSSGSQVLPPSKTKDVGVITNVLDDPRSMHRITYGSDFWTDPIPDPLPNTAISEQQAVAIASRNQSQDVQPGTPVAVLRVVTSGDPDAAPPPKAHLAWVMTWQNSEPIRRGGPMPNPSPKSSSAPSVQPRCVYVIVVNATTGKAEIEQQSCRP